MLRVLKAALFYFAIAFGVGFVLGTIRTLWLLPRLGARSAELLEMPVMLVVIMAAARLVVRKQSLPSTKSARLAVGCIGLVLMLAAEFGFMLWLRGITITQYLATRDPIAGTLYYVNARVVRADASSSGQSSIGHKSVRGP